MVTDLVFVSLFIWSCSINSNHTEFFLTVPLVFFSLLHIGFAESYYDFEELIKTEEKALRCF